MLATAFLYAWFGPSRYAVVHAGEQIEMYDKYTSDFWVHKDMQNEGEETVTFYWAPFNGLEQ